MVYLWDIDLIRGQRGPLAVPGTYTVKVTLGDDELSGPLDVLGRPAIVSDGDGVEA